ncbi:MAG: condensation domain-containing protein [Spirulinaceae cyanobacterium]
MKTINELLSHLRDLDIKVWVEGERLRYNAPKGALTSELRDRLINHKAEIISFLQQASAATKVGTVTLQPVSRTEKLLLSFAQERIWFLEYVGGKSGAYNMPLAQRLEGKLDVEILKSAIAAIIERHEALRTNFKRVRFSAAQIIHPTLEVEVPIVDLQQQPEKLQSLLTEEIQRPFNLETGPLFRVLLLRLATEEHVLLVVTHHIISDAWSEGILMKELSLLYQALQTDKPSPLPELTIQYPDFAYWQRQCLQGEVLETQLNYWQQQLKGKVPALELPYNRPTSSGNSGANQSLALPQFLTQSLKNQAREARSSLFIILLAAFKALLHSYTGQEDILICFPIAGRNHTATEKLIGYFNNILPARTDLSGDPSFKTLVERVRQVVLEASQYQDVPLQKIGEFPNLVRTPLTRGMFALQNTPQRLLNIPDLTATYLETSNGKADFDLYLILEEKGKQLFGTLSYNAELFESLTITNLLKNYQTLLESFIADPEQNLSALPKPKGKPWDSLVPIKPKGDKRPLFLVHDGLGRTMLYLNLARHLDPQRPVYALRPYGNEENPIFHKRVVEMANHYNSRIRSIQPQGPYLIGGLSFGGTIALEMAQQLQNQGQEVAFVALMDSLHIEELRKVGARKFSQDLIQQNQAIHQILPELIGEYIPSVYRGKVTLFRGSQGEGVDQPNIERTEDPLLGFEKWVEDVAVYDIPGGHYSLLQEPNVKVLAEKIETCLKVIP